MPTLEGTGGAGDLLLPRRAFHVLLYTCIDRVSALQAAYLCCTESSLHMSMLSFPLILLWHAAQMLG